MPASRGCRGRVRPPERETTHGLVSVSQERRSKSRRWQGRAPSEASRGAPCLVSCRSWCRLLRPQPAPLCLPRLPPSPLGPTHLSSSSSPRAVVVDEVLPKGPHLHLFLPVKCLRPNGVTLRGQRHTQWRTQVNLRIYLPCEENSGHCWLFPKGRVSTF